MWMLLTMAGAAEPASRIELVYRVDFDVDAMGDKLCGMTKFCDCASVYAGEGTLVESTKDRVTFQGTWRLGENSCMDALKVWVPGDGAAFHTLHLEGGKVTTWVVHRDRQAHAPRKAKIKEGGQFWMNELAIEWPTQRFESRQQDGGEMAMGVQLTGTHLLVGAVTEGPAGE